MIKHAYTALLLFPLTVLWSPTVFATEESEACVATVLSLADDGPTPERVAVCGPDVGNILLDFGLGAARNGLVRGRALTLLPLFVSPEEALLAYAAVIETPQEHSYFRMKSVGALSHFAASHPDEVLTLVAVSLTYRKEPFVRERAIDIAGEVPGRAALPLLRLHRFRERTRWVKPVLRETIGEIERRP